MLLKVLAGLLLLRVAAGGSHPSPPASRTAVSGSGVSASETRRVGPFDRLDVMFGCQVRVTQGTREALTIQADDNILPLIETDVSDGELRITTGYDPRSVQGISPKQPIKVNLTVRDLSSIRVTGSASVESSSLRSDELSLEIKGSGTMDLSVRVGTLRGRLTGSGLFEMAGRADRQEVELSGSGRYLARDLEARTCSVSVSGSGRAEVSATETLDARIAGSGHILYTGQPRVTRRVAGSGTVEPLGS